MGFTPYRLYHKPPLRGGTFHKRDKKSFPHCILLQSLFGDPSGRVLAAWA